MKKYIGLSLLLLSAAAFVPSVEAKSTVNDLTATAIANSAQYQRRVNQRGINQRRARTVTQTRNVRRGRAVYRETYRTVYRPNGRVVTRLISRVLVRRY